MNKELSTKDLVKRLELLRNAALQRIISSVALIKASADYVKEVNRINNVDLEVLKYLDKQISILNADNETPGIDGGKIEIPNNQPESGEIK